MRKMPLGGDVENSGRFEMPLKSVGGVKPRGLAAFKQVQEKQRQQSQANARSIGAPAPMKIGCISVWSIAGLVLFTIMRPAVDPVGGTAGLQEPKVVIELGCSSQPGGCDNARGLAQPTLRKTPIDEAAPGDDGSDRCGCAAGFGWSVSTGRGCCKYGSLTQDAEVTECQTAFGNTDCAPAPVKVDQDSASVAAGAKDGRVSATEAPADAAGEAISTTCSGVDGESREVYLHTLPEDNSRVVRCTFRMSLHV